MPILPKKPSERVEFFQQRNAMWSSAAANIGVTVPDVTALTTKTAAASTALAAAEASRIAAKNATQDAKDAVKEMTDAGAELIKKIKVKAIEVGGNSVYTLASLPVPATPSSKPAPGKPSDFKATLTELGALDMKWKCKNPAGTSGTMYQVYRRIGENGTPVHIGASGDKTFIDSTLPAGASTVIYQIQAVRSTVGGAWASFTVQFGQPANGVVNASVSSSAVASPKIAA